MGQGLWTCAAIGMGLLGSVAGCIGDPLLTCADGTFCPVDLVCAPAGGCAAPEWIAACVDREEGASCSLGALGEGRCRATVCVITRCGDGVTDPGEVCDDGNGVDGDGCSRDCISDEICGNGVRDAAEQCDDANDDDDDGCSHCRLPSCGDAVVSSSLHEGCDLGPANSDEPDAQCRTFCQLARCGDGIVDPGLDEVCDDGGLAAGDGCSIDCLSDETCGNGIRDTGEQCDDGNVLDGDDCQGGCLLPRCGDGILDAATLGEECDDGASNSTDPDACRPNCRLPRCGDGILDALTEVCDDGNLVSRDGCRPDCRSDYSCGNGVLDVDIDPAEVCDDGNRRAHDGCSAACRLERPVWTRGTPPLPPPMPGGYFVPVAYDAARQRVVRWSNNWVENGAHTTWEWNGSGWVEQLRIGFDGAFGGPNYPSMAYVAERGVTLALDPRGILYQWDGSAWSTDDVVASGPINESRLVWDPSHGELVAYTVEATWTHDGTGWTSHDVAPKRFLPGLTYDPSVGRIVLFGGIDSETFEGLGDTWEWSGSTWTQRLSATEPPGRYAPGLVFDEARGRLVLFGGSGLFADTWEWVGSPLAGDWVEQHPVDGPAADPVNGSLVYDSLAARVLLIPYVGGRPWQWDGNDWLEAPVQPLPVGRRGTTIAYQSAQDRLVMFGGNDGTASATDGARGDTWEWDGASWLERTGGPTPPSRFDHAMAYDPRRDRVVMFGGAGPALLGDTWEWDGAAWSTPASAASPAPSARRGASAAFDPFSERVILFGGDAGEIDTWAWDGAAWADVSGAAHPSARARAPFLLVPEQGGAVLYGSDTWGWTETGWRQLDQVAAPGALTTAITGSQVAFADDGTGLGWAYVWVNDVWMYAPFSGYPPLVPPSRVDAALAYDAARDRAIMFGGFDAGSPTGVYYNDTWSFRFEAPERAEVCASGVDVDRDGDIGCADDDCWAACSPLCPPQADLPGVCDGTTPSHPYCGDGTCTAIEQNLCPADCG